MCVGVCVTVCVSEIVYDCVCVRTNYIDSLSIVCILHDIIIMLWFMILYFKCHNHYTTSI